MPSTVIYSQVEVTHLMVIRYGKIRFIGMRGYIGFAGTVAHRELRFPRDQVNSGEDVIAECLTVSKSCG
jgi:hypothetical protein